jgi:hypothetical protein
MGDKTGMAIPGGPRSRPSGRAALRLVGIAASIAIAGCEPLAYECSGWRKEVRTLYERQKGGFVPITRTKFVCAEYSRVEGNNG